MKVSMRVRNLAACRQITSHPSYLTIDKNGRGPPTSPTLRPRVLTPRDHFAHRGGGREKIMHNSRAGCNRKLSVFFIAPFAVRDSMVADPFRFQILTAGRAR